MYALDFNVHCSLYKIVLKRKQLKLNNNLAALAKAILLSVHPPKMYFLLWTPVHVPDKDKDKIYSFNIKSKLPIS